MNEFENTDEFKWLQKNAYKYGFILRYPKNKENITGYEYESWHYRYVGEKVAKEIYGADGVTYDAKVKKELDHITQMGFGNLPVCMAKNQYSLSDDPKLLGRPQGFELSVREAYVSAGAGFVVVLTGDVMTMPGLPKKPMALNIRIKDGLIEGLS